MKNSSENASLSSCQNGSRSQILSVAEETKEEVIISNKDNEIDDETYQYLDHFINEKTGRKSKKDGSIIEEIQRSNTKKRLSEGTKI